MADNPGFSIGGFGSGLGGIASGVGQLFAAGGYKKAAELEQQNAAFTARVTGIQEQQQQREAFMAMGATEAAVGGAGFSLAGTALDLLKNSAQQASLEKNMIAVQGQIEENAYLAKAAEYSGMASASKASGIGGIIGGIAGVAGAIFSDERLKTDIKTIGFDSVGRRWVSYRYTWDAESVVRTGVIGQEIIHSDPHAVREDAGGILKVNYDRLKGGMARAELFNG